MIINAEVKNLMSDLTTNRAEFYRITEALEKASGVIVNDDWLAAIIDSEYDGRYDKLNYGETTDILCKIFLAEKQPE